ncbi:MAG: hypothetical protein R3C03_04985 [Pirellulaceae bacterium]
MNQIVKAGLFSVAAFGLSTTILLAQSTLEQQRQQAMANSQVQPQFSEQQSPPGFPLAADHQQHVDSVLDYWEKSSEQIKRCTCDFRRFDYEQTRCDWREPGSQRLAAASVVMGQIKYEAPDKALYEATESWDFSGTKNDGKEANYVQREDADLAHEKWICDGESTYEFDFINHRIYESQIDPQYRGQGLIDSPMPFLFGASRTQLLERYWIKSATPSNVTDAIWLEAFPKRQSDAQNYSKVLIVLSRSDFLPSTIQVFSPNYNPTENQLDNRVFEFGDRKLNTQLGAIQSWGGLFIRPRTPVGWTLVDSDAAAKSASSMNGSGPQNNNEQIK